MKTILERAGPLTVPIFTLLTSACSGSVGEITTPEATRGASSASAEIPATRPRDASARCLPRIETKGEWLAADGGRTIPLSNGTAIHLFGDTMLDAATTESPEAYEWIGNSIAVGKCVDGEYSVDYFWREAHGHHSAFFDIGVEGVRLWPIDGFELDGRLHLVLGKIIATDRGLGFDCIGTTWATIENPLVSPLHWRISYQDFTGLEAYRPDKGITLHGEYVYLFSTLLEGDYPYPAVLLRVAQARLDAPVQALEYLAQDGSWLPIARYDDDARIVVEQTSPNMYVHYHAGIGRFVTVHGDPAFGSHDMVIQTAELLEGPWTPGTVVYQFPEMLEPPPDGSAVICYAVTEHPQLRMHEGDTLAVSYSCNTLGGVLPSRENLRLYYPKTVTIDVSAMKTGV